MSTNVVEATPRDSIHKKAAVVIGRWQLPHLAHEELIRAAFEVAPIVVIVIGSALRARDPRNPFVWQEREQMIRCALSADQQNRVRFLPIRDYYDDERWNKAVREGVTSMIGDDSNVTLVGYKKDQTTYYLDHFPAWKQHLVQSNWNDLNATAMRAIFFEGCDTDAALSVMQPYVGAPVRSYLQSWSNLPEFQKRVSEQANVVAYRKRWPALSYNTADSLVQIGDYVLLVKRKGPFGEDLWALPGGHAEKDERFLDAALRELAEETKIPLMKSAVRRALVDSAVFDHPLRSPRTRLITFAFHFKFGPMDRLPEVEGRDDVKEARWFHKKELLALEDRTFEDHFMIADRFLSLLPR